jgi:hypothetical protein
MSKRRSAAERRHGPTLCARAAAQAGGLHRESGRSTFTPDSAPLMRGLFCAARLKGGHAIGIVFGPLPFDALDRSREPAAVYVAGASGGLATLRASASRCSRRSITRASCSWCCARS